MYGSEKQISWAKDIRAKFTASCSDETRQNAEKIESAKFWIDHRYDKGDCIIDVIDALASMTTFGNRKASELRYTAVYSAREWEANYGQMFDERWARDVEAIRQVDNENWWVEHGDYVAHANIILSHVQGYIRHKE